MPSSDKKLINDHLRLIPANPARVHQSRELDDLDQWSGRQMVADFHQITDLCQ